MGSNKNKIGSIYKITNIINGKEYIGCTIKTIENRFKEHLSRSKSYKYKSKLYNSFIEYGVENFTIILIQYCDVNIMYEMEKYYIEKLDTYKTGLNSTLGGEGTLGYFHSPEKIKDMVNKAIENGKTHKGKTYYEIYGEESEKQKILRKDSVKKNWDNISNEDKKKRVDKMKKKLRQNSKYGVDLIIKIKNEIKDGLTVKEISKLHPEIPKGRIYEIKSGKKWKDL